MIVTEEAQIRLRSLLKTAGNVDGFRIDDIIGTCRASTPVLTLCTDPCEGDLHIACCGFQLYVSSARADVLKDATLDYDPSFMGRGLVLTWPHRQHCHCQGARS